MSRSQGKSEPSYLELAHPAPTIVGTGLIALDVVYGLDKSCAPSLYAGGTCGNVLVALSSLGWKAYPIARLRGDPAGAHVRRDLIRWQTDLAFAHLAPNTSTPVVIQRMRADARGQISHSFSLTCPECRSWLPTYVPVRRAAIPQVLEAIAPPEVIFVDRLSAGAVALAEAASIKGSLIFFEPSARTTKALYQRMLAVADVVKYSRESLESVGEFRGRVPAVPLEIETMGRAGLRYRGTMFGAKSKAWRAIPGFSVTELRDSAGAGDWCTVGLLHSLGPGGRRGFQSLSRARVEEAMLLGQALGAWTCMFEGARGGMYRVGQRVFADTIKAILERRALPTVHHMNACGSSGNLFSELCGICAPSGDV